MKKIEGVNVVDIPGARMLMSSLGAGIYMIQQGVEPIRSYGMSRKERVRKESLKIVCDSLYHFLISRALPFFLFNENLNAFKSLPQPVSDFSPE